MKARLAIVFLFVLSVCANAYAQYCHEGISGGCQCVAFAYDNGFSDFVGTGNAKNWYGAASGKGYAVGHIPMVGAVMVFDSWGKNTAGHVAVIASIVSNSEVTVNHSNWAPNGNTDDRIYRNVSVKDLSGGNWTSVSVYESGSYPVLGFIYPKNPPVTSGSVCLGTVCGDAALYRAKLQTSQTVRFGTNTVSVTEVGWRPLVDQCEKAQQYFYLTKSNPTSQKYTAVPAPSSICASVVPACFAQ